MTLSVLSGKEILITSGSTRAYLDAVLYLSKQSTGHLGAEVAWECLQRGAYVSYFQGQGAMNPLDLVSLKEEELSDEVKTRLELIEIDTVPQLVGSIERELKDGYYDAVIHAMEVLDWVPDPSSVLQERSSEKQEWDLKLVPTLPIINMIKKIAPDTTLVGFRSEIDTQPDSISAGIQELLQSKGAEIGVVQDLAVMKEGGYKAVLFEQDPDSGEMLHTTIEGRDQLAGLLCDRLEKLLKYKAKQE